MLVGTGAFLCLSSCRCSLADVLGTALCWTPAGAGMHGPCPPSNYFARPLINLALLLVRLISTWASVNDGGKGLTDLSSGRSTTTGFKACVKVANFVVSEQKL